MKILICVIACCFARFCYSQDLSVRVSSATDDSPVSYAYIYVNGQVLAVSDSVGMATLRGSRLTLGDTLCATFVGMRGDTVVYDESVRAKGSCDLSLVDSYVTDEIIVRPDGRKMYLKYVLEKLFCVIRSGMDARFDFSGKWKNGREFHLTGSVSLAFSDALGGGYKTLKIVTSSDTTGLSDLMQIAFAWTLREFTWGSIYAPFNRKWNGVYSSTIDYNGRYGNIRMFTSCYRCDEYTRQTRLKVDSDSKVIKGIATELYSPQYNTFTKTDMDFRFYKQYLWPDRIDSEYGADTLTYEMRLFDTEHKAYKGNFDGALYRRLPGR